MRLLLWSLRTDLSYSPLLWLLLWTLCTDLSYPPLLASCIFSHRCRIRPHCSLLSEWFCTTVSFIPLHPCEHYHPHDFLKRTLGMLNLKYKFNNPKKFPKIFNRKPESHTPCGRLEDFQWNYEEIVNTRIQCDFCAYHKFTPNKNVWRLWTEGKAKDKRTKGQSSFLQKTSGNTARKTVNLTNTAYGWAV